MRRSGGPERKSPSEQAAGHHVLSEDGLVAPLAGLQRLPQAGCGAVQLVEVPHVQLAVLPWAAPEHTPVTNSARMGVLAIFTARLRG